MGEERIISFCDSCPIAGECHGQLSTEQALVEWRGDSMLGVTLIDVLGNRAAKSVCYYNPNDYVDSVMPGEAIGKALRAVEDCSAPEVQPRSALQRLVGLSATKRCGAFSYPSRGSKPVGGAVHGGM